MANLLSNFQHYKGMNWFIVVKNVIFVEFVKKHSNLNMNLPYILEYILERNPIHVDIVTKNSVLQMHVKLMNIFTQMKNHIHVKHVSDLLDNMGL